MTPIYAHLPLFFLQFFFFINCIFSLLVSLYPYRHLSLLSPAERLCKEAELGSLFTLPWGLGRSLDMPAPAMLTDGTQIHTHTRMHIHTQKALQQS